jgi:hypothetical protein
MPTGLRLLQSFGRPPVVTDIVRRECGGKLGAPGGERLARWLENVGGTQFTEMRTPFLPAFDDALAQVASGGNRDATTGLGDAVISWILKNLPRLKAVDGQSLAVGPGEIALVLTEVCHGPGDVPTPLQGRAQVLSTRQWLKTLEFLEIIPPRR